MNGLNQYSNVSTNTGGAFGYDLNGNLTFDGASSYTYDIENRLIQSSGSKSATLRYDPLGRLYETSAGTAATTTRLLYDGDELFAEYSAPATGSPVLLRQYGHGSGSDDPVYWIEAGLPGPSRFLHTNHQGSIVAVSQSPGTAFAINAYDEWGVPAATNQGRFQYTGQAWLPELGLYYYKARLYSPTLGRFMQTDPIGYEDNINLYAYVGNDPVGHIDPTGKDAVLITWPTIVSKGQEPHSALFIGSDIENGTLYDPSGSYARRDGFGQFSRDNSGVFENVSLERYINYFRKKGDSIDGLRLTYLKTSDEEDQNLISSAYDVGDPRGFNCASSCSSVIGILKGMESTNNSLPSNLADTAASSKRAYHDVIYGNDGKYRENNTSGVKPWQYCEPGAFCK